MRSTAVLISAGAGALPTVSGISGGMPIPLNETKNSKLDAAKGRTALRPPPDPNQR
jgi:hypothetical protein